MIAYAHAYIAVVSRTEQKGVLTMYLIANVVIQAIGLLSTSKV
jgi:hypothetical protein